MTAFFAQRIDVGRFTTPRPGAPGATEWLLLVDAPDASSAAEIAYKQWQSERMGCIGFIGTDLPVAVKEWRIKVWKPQHSDHAWVFAVSHSVVTTYYVTEEKDS